MRFGHWDKCSGWVGDVQKHILSFGNSEFGKSEKHGTLQPCYCCTFLQPRGMLVQLWAPWLNACLCSSSFGRGRCQLGY